MGGLTLAEKCEIAGLLYEAQICMTAVASGISTIATMVEAGEKPPHLGERLRALGKMTTQAEEALDALDDELEKLLDRKGAGGEDDEHITMLRKAGDTLDFYAAPKNYISERGKPSPVVKDGGQKARDTIKELWDEDSDEE